MNYKLCKKCGKKKPATKEYFHARSTSLSSDGLQSWCKECKKKRAKEDYRSDPVKGKMSRKEAKIVAQERNRSFVYKYLQDHHCVDCGESRWQVLEFDHVRGEKEYNISYMVKSGLLLQKIEVEIAKCDVRCANCHRLKTANDFGYRQNPTA